MTNHPTRAAGIEVNEVADGFVVHDAVRDRVHYLNHTAALVLEFCTGDNPTDRIVAMVQHCYELAQPPHDMITTCLEQLRAEGLVT